jgi:O-antigen/teichoic acid export membrane protein
VSSLGKRLFKQGVLYGAARLVPQALGFLLLPVYARYLGREGYGTLSLVTTIGMVASLVIGQGQTSALFRLRFKYTGEQRQVLLTTVFWYQLASVALGLGLLLVIGPPLVRRFLPEVEFFPLLVFGVAGALVKGASDSYLRTLQAQQKARAYFFQFAGQGVTSAGLAVVLIVALGRGAEGRIEADLIAALVFFTIGAIALRPSAPWRASGTHLRETLRFGWPLIWHQLANWVNSLSDRLVVNYFLGLSAAGLYSMGYKVASAVGLVATAMNQAWSSQLYRSLTPVETDGEAERTEKLEAVRSAARSQLVQTSLLGIGVTTLAKEVLALMSNGTFSDSAAIVPLVVAGIIVFAGYQPFPAALAFYDKTRLLPIFSTSSAVVNVALNLVLVPTIGIQGAALATLLSNVMCFALGYRFCAGVFQCYPSGFLPALALRVAIVLGSLAALDHTPGPMWALLGVKLIVGLGGCLWVLRLASITVRGLVRELRAWRT